LNGWIQKFANTEQTPQAIWPTAKSLSNRDGLSAPTAIQDLLGQKYHPVDKANAIADCLENQFIPQDLRDENHERQVEASRVQALLEAADSDPSKRTRPCDLQILLNSLKLKKASKRMPPAPTKKITGSLNASD
jgi:hypothetical protein